MSVFSLSLQPNNNQIVPKWGSNVTATIQWPSSLQYRQYNCMRIKYSKGKAAGIKGWVKKFVKNNRYRRTEIKERKDTVQGIQD